MEIALDRPPVPAVRPQPALVYVPHPLLVASRRQLIEAHALPGESLEAYFRRALAVAPIDDPRVVWVASIGGARVPRAMWARTFPKPGMTVWLTMSVAGGGGNGKNPLASILSIGLFFAAPYLGAALSSGLGFAAGAEAFSIFGASIKFGQLFTGLVSIAGSLLIGRLFQPSRPELSRASGAQAQASPTYSITGGANRARLFDVMPLTMGRHIAFLDYGAKPYTEYIGDDQYLYQVFNAGLSDVTLSSYRIGNTAIENYPDVTIQESGGDGKITLVPGNVDTLAGGALEYNVAVVRTSSPDAIALAVDINGQAYAVSDEGQIQGAGVAWSIEYRAIGSTVWLPFVGASSTVATTGRSDRKPMRLTYKRDVARAQYEVRVVNQTNAAAFDNSDRYTFEFSWTQLRTYQPDDADYTGQKRIGVKIKASSLASGQLDQFNALATARHEVWTGAAWVLQATSNPAWIARWFILGKRIGGRVVFGCDRSDADLDLASFKAFGAWCDAKNLTFNLQLDFSRNAGEVLDMILRCGRGRRTRAGGKLGVVWDAGGQPVVASFGMGNIKRESFAVEYISQETPDGMVVRFINPDNNWEQDEVRCKRPGVSDPVNYAQMEIIGCTDRDMAGREGNLAAAAYEYLRRRVTLEQDIEGVVTTAGDVAAVTHDLTQWGYSGRLVAGTSTVLTLDRPVPFTPGYQHYVRIEFPNKYFTVLRVQYFAGETDVITLLDALPVLSDKGVTLYAPNADPSHPPLDYKWSFEPKSTPGRLMKVIGHEPRGDGVRFTLSDEVDAYYAAEYSPFEYVAAGGTLTAAPTLTNLQVIEELVRSGNGYASLITITWDALGVTDIAVVRAAMNGAPLEEKARLYGRRMEFLVTDTGPLSYQVTLFGPRGQWAPGGQISGTLDVLGDGGPPSSVITFTIDGNTLRWSPVNWAALGGYRLKYHFGDYRSWVDGAQLIEGLVTENQFTMDPRPAGPLTLMVKAVSSRGVESADPAYVVTDLGDAVGDHVLATIDFKAAGFPGTITGGALAGGNLEAGSTTAFYGADDAAPIFGPDDGAEIYVAAVYSEMTYETAEFSAPRVVTGSMMTLSTAIAGAPYFIEYRATGTSPFYSGYDMNPIFGPDDAAAIFAPPPDYSAWPGALAVSGQPYQLRVRIAQGGTQGVISAFAAVIDAPTTEEFFNDVTIGAGGSRLPITKAWDTIVNVQLTLEADGGAAINAKWLDKSATLGPLVQCFDNAGAGTSGRLDARIKGYLQ